MNSENNSSHKCTACLVFCIDFRFQKFFYDWSMKRFPQDCDIVAAAGGVKEIVFSQKQRKPSFLLSQLKLSHDLHKTSTIVLIQHEDCGAYGGSASFENFEKEKEFQQKELHLAEEIVKKEIPGVNVEKYFVRLSGEFIKIE